MRKNILLSLILIILFSGLYGCSCSQTPTDDPELTPGLYIDKFSFAETSDGETQVTLNVNLERNSTASVTVNYEIKASTDENKALATIGTGEDADIKVSSLQNVLTFDETTGNVLTIPVTLVGDTMYELDEVFIVELTAASGANIVSGVAEITITNDDPAPKAVIELADVNGSLSLSESLPESVEMKVSLDAISGVDATVVVSRSSEISTDPSKYGTIAAFRIDYILYRNGAVLPEGAELIIPAGEQEVLLQVVAVDDGLRENTETFSLGLNEQSHVSTASTTTLDYSIEDNNTLSNGVVVGVSLNDTGVVDLPTKIFVADGLDGQLDKSLGRDNDVTVESKTGAGVASFDFTKISSVGEAMADATIFTETPWDCVKDNNTGLYWEVKVPGEATERGAGRLYHWYDPNFSTNGGSAGVTGRYNCEINDSEAGSKCNTSYYVADINASKNICNMTGWRLPTIEELRSIVDYGATSIRYDVNYFAGDQIGSSFIWSSTTVAGDPEKAWAIRFGLFSEEAQFKANNTITGVRLVNDSKITNSQ